MLQGGAKIWDVGRNQGRTRNLTLYTWGASFHAREERTEACLEQSFQKQTGDRPDSAPSACPHLLSVEPRGVCDGSDPPEIEERGGEWERKPPPIVFFGRLSGTMVPDREPASMVSKNHNGNEQERRTMWLWMLAEAHTRRYESFPAKNLQLCGSGPRSTTWNLSLWARRFATV